MSKKRLPNILKTWQPKKIKKGVHCISDGSNKNPSNPVTPSESSSGGGFGGGANNAAAWADIAPEGKTCARNGDFSENSSISIP